MTVSALLITYNDVDRVQSTIETLWRNCDELVIIDNGSSDGTVELCRNLGAKSSGRIVFFGPDGWRPENTPGGLTRARNFGLRNASGDWVLVLDSDERLDDSQTILVSRSEKVSGYFARWNTHWDDGRITTDYKLAMIRRDSGIHFEGLIHENPTASARRLGLQCGMLEVGVVNRPRVVDIGPKRRRYVEHLRMALEIQPNCARLHWFLGLSLYTLGQFEAARTELVAAATTHDVEYPIERTNASFLLGYGLALQGETETAERWLACAEQLWRESRNDIEMVAYGLVRHRMAEVWKFRTDLNRLLTLDPADLFYCGWQSRTDLEPIACRDAVSTIKPGHSE